MSERSRQKRDYFRGAELTLDVVTRLKPTGPAFAFPPKEIAVIASLADHGMRLVRNAAAAALVAELMAESKRRNIGDYPTFLMLQAALEMNEIPYEVASLSDLGLKVPTA